MSKGPEAFRTISEVAGDLELPQHVLRFWETRFAQIRPMKRGGGRRYYRPDDVELLRGIRQLLYGHGYTIRGVQRILRDQGPRFVTSVGRGDDGSVPAPNAEDVDDEQEAPTISRRARVEAADQVDDEGDDVAVEEHAPAPRPRLRLPAVLTGRSRQEDAGTPATGGALSKEEVRRLQGTLFELLECKRLLDQAR